MRDGLSVTAAVDQVRKEGVTMLYRGVLSPLGMRATSLSIMFGSYGSYKQWFEVTYPKTSPHVILAISAVLAGVTEATFAIPFERVQTLLLDKKFNSKFHNTLHTVRHLAKKHPMKEFYRGSITIVFRNSLGNLMFFSSREQVQKYMPKEGTVLTKFIIDFIK